MDELAELENLAAWTQAYNALIAEGGMSAMILKKILAKYGYTKLFNDVNFTSEEISAQKPKGYKYYVITKDYVRTTYKRLDLPERIHFSDGRKQVHNFRFKSAQYLYGYTAVYGPDGNILVILSYDRTMGRATYEFSMNDNVLRCNKPYSNLCIFEGTLDEAAHLFGRPITRSPAYKRRPKVIQLITQLLPQPIAEEIVPEIA